MESSSEYVLNNVEQQSSTFLAPGTGFIEENFLMGLRWGWFLMIQAHYIYSALYFYY